MQHDPLFALWRVLVVRGLLRRGEIVALRGADFDFTDREMAVREQMLVIRGVPLVGPPKSAAGVRRLALDEDTNRVQREHWLCQVERFADNDGNTAGFMFTWPDGRPLRPDWLTHRFAALVRELDLPPIRLHDLRHGAASLAGAAGVSLKVIQHDMGHSS